MRLRSSPRAEGPIVFAMPDRRLRAANLRSWRGPLFAVFLLFCPGPAPAQYAATFYDCALACWDECRGLPEKRCARLIKACARRGLGLCGEVPDCALMCGATTTTVQATATTSTSTSAPTTTTTLPAWPDYSVYSGGWLYTVSRQEYVGCTTNYPTQFGGTLQLSVSPQGGIIGTVNGPVAIAGSFTSFSSASVSSQMYTDPFGCAATFDADVTSFTTTQGVLDLYLYEQCPGGPVCADYYVGVVAR